jgi:uncharacterized membrane protein
MERELHKNRPQLRSTGEALKASSFDKDVLFRRLILLFGLVGLAVSLYLTYIKVNPASLLCTGVGDCEAVNSSAYSEIRGIPIALLGALAYAAILGTLLLEKRSPFLSEWGPVVIFGMAFAGTLYSAYLTYIEIAVLEKICPYCVTSAVAITAICVLSGVRLKRTL